MSIRYDKALFLNIVSKMLGETEQLRNEINSTSQMWAASHEESSELLFDKFEKHLQKMASEIQEFRNEISAIKTRGTSAEE